MNSFVLATLRLQGPYREHALHPAPHSVMAQVGCQPGSLAWRGSHSRGPFAAIDGLGRPNRRAAPGCGVCQSCHRSQEQSGSPMAEPDEVRGHWRRVGDSQSVVTVAYELETSKLAGTLLIQGHNFAFLWSKSCALSCCALPCCLACLAQLLCPVLQCWNLPCHTHSVCQMLAGLQ